MYFRVITHQYVEDYKSMRLDFPDEDVMFIRDYRIPDPIEGPESGSRWTLVFDSASNALCNGIRVIITSPTDHHILFTTRLCFDYTNDMAEYKACILEIDVSIDLRIGILEVYGDSTLVIYQIKGDWETLHPNLIPYRDHILKLIPYFDDITFHHIPREENQLADALDTLSSMFKVKRANEAHDITIEHLDEAAYCLVVEAETDGKPWFYDIKQYLKKHEYPEDASITNKKTFKKLSVNFFLSGNVLYKRNFDMVLLRCVDRQKEDILIKEIHECSFDTHANGHSMEKKILKVGYYWLTMDPLCQDVPQVPNLC
ncbi:uncharacterized protein LOC127096254 [Lathyrus oleraceus]|uniref:uncharacterized protein LOC127096254 n=1 Tax=Pisum sativum TaxID=3888 RepID=UPI0021D2F35C|nr:uncharacterized protein LOC127096254 [Pisum sativum]